MDAVGPEVTVGAKVGGGAVGSSKPHRGVEDKLVGSGVRVGGKVVVGAEVVGLGDGNAEIEGVSDGADDDDGINDPEGTIDGLREESSSPKGGGTIDSHDGEVDVPTREGSSDCNRPPRVGHGDVVGSDVGAEGDPEGDPEGEVVVGGSEGSSVVKSRDRLGKSSGWCFSGS